MSGAPAIDKCAANLARALLENLPALAEVHLVAHHGAVLAPEERAAMLVDLQRRANAYGAGMCLANLILLGGTLDEQLAIWICQANNPKSLDAGACARDLLAEIVRVAPLCEAALQQVNSARN